MVATRILAKHNNNMRNYNELGRPLYRTKDIRRQDPRTNKGNWFRKTGDTATIFVPATIGSELAKGIRQVLLSNPGPVGTRTKVVEKPGKAIHCIRAKNNPFPRKVCHRENCPLKLAGKECREKCSKENIVYRATCSICTDRQTDNNVTQPVQRVYIGESS